MTNSIYTYIQAGGFSCDCGKHIIQIDAAPVAMQVFCTKKGLSNPWVYGIVIKSAGDDDWVPCGVMP